MNTNKKGRWRNLIELSDWEVSQIKGLAEGNIIDLESEKDELSDYGSETLALFKSLLEKVKHGE